MTTPDPITPAESHRRRLACFARWLSAVADASPEVRDAIVALGRRIDRNGMTKAETTAALDSLDDLLADVWTPRPDEHKIDLAKQITAMRTGEWN